MNFKKIITNSLAIVGAVVIIDKIVDVVTNKGTKAVCDALNEDDFNSEDYNEDCCCNNFEDEDNTCQCDEACECYDESVDFPNIEKYDKSDKTTFEYTIKTENITSEPKEV